MRHLINIIENATSGESELINLLDSWTGFMLDPDSSDAHRLIELSKDLSPVEFDGFLYRGYTIPDDDQAEVLKNGGTITVTPRGVLESWTPDHGTALEFAEIRRYEDGKSSAVIRCHSSELKMLINVNQHLPHAPEREIIVASMPMVMNGDNTMEVYVFSYDED